MPKPNVDFYILHEATAKQAELFACDLIEKNYANQEPVYIHIGSRDEAEQFDRLLWTFRDISFLPHSLYQSDDRYLPIQIGYSEKPADHNHILINLTSEIPTFYAQFNRVIEIVFAETHVQQLARERYKHYRDQGCEINTYKTNTRGNS